MVVCTGVGRRDTGFRSSLQGWHKGRTLLSATEMRGRRSTQKLLHPHPEKDSSISNLPPFSWTGPEMKARRARRGEQQKLRKWQVSDMH